MTDTPNRSDTTAALTSICGDAARYDRGECDYPKCGCDLTQPGDRPQTTGQPLDYRAEKFAAMVRSGMTRRQVGARAGLTGERVAQIIEPIMGRMSFRETWKGTRDEELSERWMRGETAADIAAALGISRNAVIGKAHRLGLPARPSPIKRKG